jgi:surface polysaccharide O-acyltransferase-like enzyme
MFHHVNYLAVLVAGVVIFILGGLWYSPALFAKKWTALMGKTEAEMKAAAASASIPAMYAVAFLCSLVIAWALAIVIGHFGHPSLVKGLKVAGLCWLGFAATTSFATGLFSMTPKPLWLINSGYNLVSFLVAGAILGVWR